MYTRLLFLSFLTWMLISCQEEKENPNKNLTLEAFSEMRRPDYVVDFKEIKRQVRSLARTDQGELAADKQARAFYHDSLSFLWIDRHGIDQRADSLMAFLNEVEKTGMSPELFRRKQLAIDLQRIRNLDVGDSVKDINKVLARLEYNLTKAFMRYCTGQRFGYLNADYVMNHCDVKDSDSLHVTYNHVFDIKVKHPDKTYFASLVRKIAHDSVTSFLHEVQPRSALYKQLYQRLNTEKLTPSQRLTTICNLERSRWCLEESPEQYKKYVLVNVPAYRLYAVCPDSTMSMRVGCGAQKSKTPLLTSKINRMDVNPQWIVPKSIAKGIVYSHGYLQRNNMYVYDRKLGNLGPTGGSFSKIMDGKQYIVQRGGPGNSLGRIIFRFPNNHAVYLHDTSSPWVFDRSFRAVSHGCVRVQRPFDLARFLLKDPGEGVLEKIRYSMTADMRPHEGEPGDGEDIDKEKLIHQVRVDPEIPLFITYYTLYPNQEGILTEYKDVYGYDRALKERLKPYIE